MPEFLPVWRDLVDVAGGSDDIGRFLSFWCPPRYLSNCSQVVGVDDDGPFLIRNYDFDPALNEATLLRSAWKGRPVIATLEGMAGAADGINAASLAVSLTFGGRRNIRRGFVQDTRFVTFLAEGQSVDEIPKDWVLGVHRRRVASTLALWDQYLPAGFAKALADNINDPSSADWQRLAMF